MRTRPSSILGILGIGVKQKALHELNENTDLPADADKSA